MTHLPRRTIFLAAATVIVAGVTGCAGIEFTPWGQPTPTGMENAPYPADLDHLDDILALGETTLPEGAIAPIKQNMLVYVWWYRSREWVMRRVISACSR